MQSLCDKYADKQSDVTYTNNSVTIKVDGSGNDNYAIIPIIKSDNWTVTVSVIQTRLLEYLQGLILMTEVMRLYLHLNHQEEMQEQLYL